MDKKMTRKEYMQWSQKEAPKTRKGKNMLMAFLIGGTICTIAQIINSFLLSAGMVQEDAGTVTTLIMIFLGAFLTGLNVYDDIGRIGGAGAAIPVTGFANSIVSPAMSIKKKDMLWVWVPGCF
jgi:stage V sporulation protein AC